MIKISYEIDGKTATKEQFFASFSINSIIGEIIEDMSKAISSVKCPDHGENPTLIAKGVVDGNFEYEVVGCCEKAKDLAMNKIDEL